jgi:putative ABC transport system substrate-binding protein
MWPIVARAQQTERMQRIGVLIGIAEGDPAAQLRYAAFSERLQQLGWIDGRNVRIDARWAGGDLNLVRKYARELVGLAPDVIVSVGAISIGAVLQATSTVPVVFAVVPDPVGAGYVESLSRPAGNATGFAMFEYTLSAKWPELLKQVAPGVNRAAVLRDTLPSGIGQFAVIQSVAPTVGVEVIPVDLRDASEVERRLQNFAHSTNGGLIVTGSTSAVLHRNLIITLAAQYKLPAIYIERSYVVSGGLISYGPNYIDQYRGAADYVNRILKGEKPADLPVQAPTKYELTINLRTAKALGLDISPTLLARADEVIE